MTLLYHFSEEPNIELFKPRVKRNRQDMPPVVWAIDHEHEYTFYFPRDCPRIVYRKTEGISNEDNCRFFGVTNADTIITIENHWYQAIMNTTTYRYSMPAASFKLFDKTAGYYISEQEIKPIEIIPIGNLLSRLLDLGVDLRFTTNLYPLRDAIIQSTIKDFGIHRFENAKKQ
jgi:hypothetical protein